MPRRINQTKHDTFNVSHRRQLRYLAETINGLYKAELIHRQSWRSREAVEIATLKWVHWFNHQRLLGSIGHIPPAEAEANFYQQHTGQAVAA
ncbi:integrase core domain-containing protein [Ectopseudomonas chengduensis]